jgi:GT2 family glycosyltransferase
MQSDVSVVVAVHRRHNKPGFLGACLKSIEWQRFPGSRFEVIVVADGCKLDRSLLPEGLNAMVIEGDRNMGPAAARNIGLRAAGGEYLALIDADAEADPRWLQMLRDGFERSYVGAVAGRIVDQNGRWENREWLFPKGMVPPFSGFGNMMMKKQALQAVGYLDPKLRNGEDVDFCYRLTVKAYTLAYEAKAVVRHQRDYPLLDGFASGVYRRRFQERYGGTFRFESSPWKTMKKLYENSAHMPSAMRECHVALCTAGYIIESMSPALERWVEEMPGRAVKTAVEDGGGMLVKPADIIWWIRRNEIIVVDRKTSEIHIVDGAGKDIWEGVMDGKTREQIASANKETYGITLGRTREDVDEFVDELVKNGLLKAAKKSHSRRGYKRANQISNRVNGMKPE